MANLEAPRDAGVAITPQQAVRMHQMGQEIKSGYALLAMKALQSTLDAPVDDEAVVPADAAVAFDQSALQDQLHSMMDNYTQYMENLGIQEGSPEYQSAMIEAGVIEAPEPPAEPEPQLAPEPEVVVEAVPEVPPPAPAPEPVPESEPEPVPEHIVAAEPEPAPMPRPEPVPATRSVPAAPRKPKWDVRQRKPVAPRMGMVLKATNYLAPATFSANAFDRSETLESLSGTGSFHPGGAGGMYPSGAQSGGGGVRPTFPAAAHVAMLGGHLAANSGGRPLGSVMTGSPGRQRAAATTRDVPATASAAAPPTAMDEPGLHLELPTGPFAPNTPSLSLASASARGAAPAHGPPARHAAAATTAALSSGLAEGMAGLARLRPHPPKGTAQFVFEHSVLDAPAGGARDAHATPRAQLLGLAGSSGLGGDRAGGGGQSSSHDGGDPRLPGGLHQRMTVGRVVRAAGGAVLSGLALPSANGHQRGRLRPAPASVMAAALAQASSTHGIRAMPAMGQAMPINLTMRSTRRH
ncbi:hypothetical protein CXG81DRAFT_18111 [Caulochytrium protostelioides]|uniref:Uncharacterized protein n=1 Tax=Caulochytrium protostelioides TaxID=1555241 RepID=A0A4P9XA28_9FUNG|nr:hypothetical protein CXG81DRAFT_18111 [Caulochytrium protostelioides]|eukprot:RKP02213.1 hypothetical protein CXG81DRAFT_18111 [Caulochytrium protostelioides]